MAAMTRIGARVLIAEDCREGGDATGKYGTFEGNFALTVAFGYQSEEMEKPEFKPGEHSYEAYKDGSLKMVSGEPANLHYLEWEIGKPCPHPLFAMPNEYPRIRLDNGSVIWGCECWWAEDEEGLSLDQAKAETEDAKDFLRALAHAIPHGARE